MVNSEIRCTLGESKRKKAEQAARAAARPGSVLPKTHFDFFRERSPQAYDFLARDLKRLRANEELRVEDILPPKSNCSEDEYIGLYAEHARRFPHLHPELASGSGATSRILDQMLREYRFVLGYERYERTTYFMSAGLCDALAYTQMNLQCDDLRLPVECFAMVFANDTARTAYAAFAKHPIRPDSVLTVYVRDDNVAPVGFRRLLIMVVENSPSGEMLSAVGRQLALRSDWDLEQALRTDWNKAGVHDLGNAVSGMANLARNEDGSYSLNEGVQIEAFFEEGLLFFRMIINGIMYIASRDAELVPRADGEVAQAPSGVDGRQGKARLYQEAGPSVEAMPVVVDPKSRLPETEVEQGHRRQVSVRFLVPGFYRRSPNSPLDAKRTVWVRPHMRGPDMADLIHRPYIVK